MSKIHGMHLEPEYRVWASMKFRCLNPNDEQFDDYGGRGISVDPSWAESFGAFISDMGRRPKGSTLDRIDNDGPYSKSNCRWASRAQQARNKTNNVWVIVCGERMIFEDAINLLGIAHSTAFALIQFSRRSHQEAIDFYISKRGIRFVQNTPEAIDSGLPLGPLRAISSTTTERKIDMAKISTTYEANDGKKFSTELEADAHDAALALAPKVAAYAAAAGLGKAEATRALRYISGYQVFSANDCERAAA